MLRSTKQGEAPGMDRVPSDILHYLPQLTANMVWPLITKMVLWAVEPIQFKGGYVRWLHKKGAWDDVENLRGILLSSTIGKRAHALFRAPLMDHLDTVRDKGQLGGVKHQETLYGNQFMRTFVRTMDAAGFVSAIVFVDLSTAFHSMVRELLSGIDTNTEDNQGLQIVLDNVKRIASNTIALQESLKQQGYMAAIDTPEVLQRLVKEISKCNWAKAEEKFVQTHKGTRPGSPLADCLFHFLMSQINTEVCQALEADQVTKELCQRLHFSGSPILWADDMAVGVAAYDNDTILQSVEEITTKIHYAFAARGMKLNYAKQKTEALVTFKGKNMQERFDLKEAVVDWRKRHLLDCDAGGAGNP